MNIKENLAAVQRRIIQAAQDAQRDPKTIKLLAVSKTMPAEALAEAYNSGQRIFAENRVQEWQEKVPVLPQDCEWHLIGRLQTNKVKYLDGRITLIHSLDRFNLLQTLEEYGAKRGLAWSTLIQVNVAGDQAKAGLEPAQLGDFLEAVHDCHHVKVYGLMTIGALEATPAETRMFFRALRSLRDEHAKKDIPGVDLRELSMGMSQDFVTAIEEGATMVRVGRQIFGERHN